MEGGSEYLMEGLRTETGREDQEQLLLTAAERLKATGDLDRLVELGELGGRDAEGGGLDTPSCNAVASPSGDWPHHQDRLPVPGVPRHAFLNLSSHDIFCNVSFD